jgi:Mg/Co/Ni transporter MgtE
MVELTNYIANDFDPIDGNQVVNTVKVFFHDCQYSHFPVVEDGIYVGSIVADDIITFDDLKNVIDYRYSFERFFVKESMIWLDVLSVFTKNSTNVVPVLNEENQYIGYYKIEDFIRFLQETPFIEETGGTVVIKKNTIKYSVSEISQIVESNNGRVLGLFVSEIESGNTILIVKIAAGILNEIIQSFRRYDYEIISKHDEDNYINTLKERTDYLEKYLNI